MELSPHQQAGPCDKCATGASEQMHCAWCGYDAPNIGDLLVHVGGQCGREIARVLGPGPDPNRQRRIAADKAKRQRYRHRR